MYTRWSHVAKILTAMSGSAAVGKMQLPFLRTVSVLPVLTCNMSQRMKQQTVSGANFIPSPFVFVVLLDTFSENK